MRLIDLDACPCSKCAAGCDLKCGRYDEWLRTPVDVGAKWISVKDRLPNEGEFVLILADSIQVARIIKGITEEERTRMRNGEVEDPPVLCWNAAEGYHNVPRSSLYGAADVKGNNMVPYSWKANGGPQTWFGQEVSHWMPLPEPPEDENS